MNPKQSYNLKNLNQKVNNLTFLSTEGRDLSFQNLSFVTVNPLYQMQKREQNNPSCLKNIIKNFLTIVIFYFFVQILPAFFLEAAL